MFISNALYTKYASISYEIKEEPGDLKKVVYKALPWSGKFHSYNEEESRTEEGRLRTALLLLLHPEILPNKGINDNIYQQEVNQTLLML
jgi:hypothetical protein